MSCIYPPNSLPELFVSYFEYPQKYDFRRRSSLIDTTKEEEAFYEKIIRKDVNVIKKYINTLTPKNFRDTFKLLLNKKKANKIILAQEALEEKIAIEKLTKTIEDKTL